MTIKKYIKGSILDTPQKNIGHGVNWEVVSRIIDDATSDDLDVYVYYL